MGQCCSPWYNEHFCYKLDFLAYQETMTAIVRKASERQKGLIFNTGESSEPSCSLHVFLYMYDNQTGKLHQQTKCKAVI